MSKVSASGHVAYECASECDAQGCPYCQGGLFTCTVCKCSECELPTHCPGEPVDSEMRERICSGEADYEDGLWTESERSQ